MEEQIMAVRSMQNYIKRHLYENITLSALAEVSHYSPWHSYRLFKELLNITPADYIRRLRLSKSALRLRDENVKIIDVAFECGFLSVDGYQRAFRHEFGCNPGEYSVSPSPLYLFTPYEIQTNNIRKEDDMIKVKNIYIQVVEKPERKAIIKRGISADNYFSYCEEVGCDIWGLLVSMKSLCGEPVCMWLPKKYIKSGTSEYVQGVEVAADYSGEIPNGLDVINLPACAYMMFQSKPFAEEDFEQAIEQVWEAIKKYNPETVGYSFDDTNPRIQLEPIGSRGYIELVPIKKL